MFVTLLKTINDVGQIVGKGIAFILGAVLSLVCWPLIKIVGLLTAILWFIAFIPSWIAGHLLMFALDLDPEKCRQEFQAREDMKKVRRTIEKALREHRAKEAEKNDDPS